MVDLIGSVSHGQIKPASGEGLFARVTPMQVLPAYPSEGLLTSNMFLWLFCVLVTVNMGER